MAPVPRTRKRVYRKKNTMLKKKKRYIKRGVYRAPTTMYTKELICADRCVVPLRYISIDEYALPAQPLLPLSTSLYNLNGLFDISPTLGSTDIPGFTAWSGFYSSYRAISANIRCTFFNTSNFVQYAMLVVLPNTSGAPTTWQGWMEQRGNQYSRFTTLEPVGSNVSKTIRMKVPFSDLIGNAYLYKSNLNYEGRTVGNIAGGANPGLIQQLYLVTLSFTPAGLLANSTPYNMTIDYEVEYYNRINKV